MREVTVREAIGTFSLNVRDRVWPRIVRRGAAMARTPHIAVDVIVCLGSNAWHRARPYLRRRTMLDRLNSRWGCSD
jgi:hypothetical protein